MRKTNLGWVAGLFVGFCIPAALAQPFSESFTTSGNHSFTVPEGVTELEIEIAGGGGGGGSGGSAASSAFVNPFTGETIRESTATGADGGDGALGEVITQVISVAPGDVLTIVVGAGGAGGEVSNSEPPKETTFGGGGGAGNPGGGDGGDAFGGYDDDGEDGVLSGGGGGAGGGSSMTWNGSVLSAAGGAGGGGGGAAFGLDTDTGVLEFAGTPGAPASAGGEGGLCDGYANPLAVSLVNDSMQLAQYCEPHPDGSTFDAEIPEQGGAGAPGYTAGGDAAGTGGAGAPTVTGGELFPINGVPVVAFFSEGEPGAPGADGYVTIAGEPEPPPPPPPPVPPEEVMPIPVMPGPLLLLWVLVVGGLGLRRLP